MRPNEKEVPTADLNAAQLALLEFFGPHETERVFTSLKEIAQGYLRGLMTGSEHPDRAGLDGLHDAIELMAILNRLLVEELEKSA